MRKLFFSLSLLLLVVGVAFAQPAGKDGDPAGRLMAELDLTAEQQQRIKTIRQEARRDVKALWAANAGDGPDREQVKAIRQEARTATEAVLTPGQLTRFNALVAERKAAMAKVDRAGLRQALQNYRNANIRPVLAAARSRFDEVLTPADRATLARLRPIMATRPGAKAGERPRPAGKPTPEQREQRRAAAKAWRADHRAELAELKALTQRYATQLERLAERLAPQKEQWRADLRAIRADYLPEGVNPRRARGGKGKAKPGKRAGKRPDMPKDGKRWKRGAAFLLLDGK